MQNDALQETTEILARNRRRRVWKKAVSVLACIVVFCTTYALILPGLTMEKTAYCGIEPHQHGSECYEKTLICGMDEGESAAHRHTDECYELNLACGKEEHTHALSCYSDSEADVESQELWQSSISGVELTGNWRSDLIAVAESQLGYTESSRNYIVAEDGETVKGYTRYGAWYGDSYGDWSAMFVSFCLNYADIPAEQFPQESGCARWVSELQKEEYGFYVAATGVYEPLAGDLIFFDRDGDGSCDHVGLVAERTEGEQGALIGIKTIEGNVDNQVQRVSYSIGDETILGYAVLPNNPRGRITHTFMDEDYKFTVTYGSEAKLPEGAELKVSEYAKDSERYQQRYAEAAELYGWEADNCDGVRLFNIGFYLDGEEIEPAAEVDITITYFAQRAAENYRIICFGGEPKTLEAKSVYEDGEQDIDFTLDHPSDIMAVAAQKADTTQTETGTVQGITPNGTVINVFDYWLLERNSPDLTENMGSTGINKDHALKFTADGFGTATNKWTGNENPRSGLVGSKLGSDGYPYLTEEAASQSGTDDITPESLAYLFDPTMENDYKKTFRNAGGLLMIDEEGYYYYDCAKNFAALDETTGQFTLYGKPGVHPRAGGTTPGMFFPFNKFEESEELGSTDTKLNHYFGVTMTSRFVQRHGGHTNSVGQTATIFEFAGDDDVWVFIDGVLVGDLGGIHDRAKLHIDFSTGEVLINGEKKDTLKGFFDEAGVETNAEEWNGNTFADNTYHTLKFFYLERGNYASNMLLKYNLTVVPATTIYKTNQYGAPIGGVEFTVYKSDENWNEYNPVYTGTTDDDGALTFVDDDNKPYTLNELSELFGEYCILKETKAPPGHRLVSTEVHLRISDKTLWCDNTYESGVWAMVTLQITAPMKLKLVVNDVEQDFYGFGNDGTGSNGTLFGVVVKRIGNGPIGKLTSWAPVSGNSTDGYDVHHLVGENDQAKAAYFKEQAIKIAKEKGSVFAMAPSGAMELTMTDLPGKITEYLYMLDADNKDKAKFTTVYYWTSASSLADATPENTFRVDSDAADPNAFYRTFGATIEVPNLCNRLIVQKFGENETLIDGAVFALFKANENGKYAADDGSAVDLIEGAYTTEVNFNADDDTKSSAVITMDGKTISAVELRRTNSDVLEGSPGTCVFGIREKPLETGCYYLMEVEAPPGYKINTKPVMVRVTDEAIYANAGVANDGIQVARGPGYISSTLHKAASDGDVDNTLTWIYQKLKVSGASSSFSDAIPTSDNFEDWSYAQDEAGRILASYLHYTRKQQHLGIGRFLANYEVDNANERPVYDGTVRTYEQQIATDVGWSYNEIYQDYAYGIKLLNELGSDANYTDLSNEGDISNLFSRSVYVRVTDEPMYSDLEISKEVTGAPLDSNATFTFTVNVDSATGEYAYDIYKVNDRATLISAGKISNGGAITLQAGQVAVIKKLPGFASYTVSETPVTCYNASYSIDGAVSVAGFVAEETLNWAEGETGSRVSKVAFTNAYVPPLDLTLHKYAAGTGTPLGGARFVLYTEGENPLYYNEEGKWVQLSEENTPDSLSHTTSEDGTIAFTGILDGEYVLKEIAAPAGYQLRETEIAFTVSGGKVVDREAEFTDNSITVYNNTAHELPETGGGGVRAYITGGALLTGSAGTALLYINRKRRRENSASP